MPSVALLVGGKNYGGWQSVRVTRSIETLCGSFDLGVTERWFNQNTDWPIGEGDLCEVKLGGETVVTGYLDDRKLSFGGSEHSVSVSGRDRAGDLADCSAVLDKWEFKNLSLLKFVEKVCAPFGIKVSVQAGLATPPVIAKLSIDPGDTAFNVIEQACRHVGVLPVSDGRGGLVLTRAGTTVCSTALVQGENIKAASATFSHSERYRRYLVLGQNRGTDSDHGTAVSKVRGSATDLGVSRTERVLLVRSEVALTKAQAQARAEWETAVRAARSQAISVTVQGWTQNSGALWPVNQLVQVKAPNVGVNTALLITQVTYSYSRNEGTIAVLDLKPPTAFLPQPVIGKNGRAGLWPEIAKGV